MIFDAEEKRLKEIGISDYEDIIKDLIKDEQEAVAAYEKAIEKIGDNETLKHILKEEQEHIVELNKML